MEERQQYWMARHLTSDCGSDLELRSKLAWELLRHFGIVAGTVVREDSAGRSVTDLMPVEENVARCFALADAFVDTAEARGGLRPFSEARVEDSFRRGGELAKIKSDAEFERIRERTEKMVKEVTA